MIDRTRHNDQFEEIDRAVTAALDALEREARDNAAQHDRPDMVEKEIAYSLLHKAQLHAREVAFTWDAEARQHIGEARDILREHYSKPENIDKSRYDLDHCETALAAMDRQGERRSGFADYMEKLKAERGDREPASDRSQDQDIGRER